MAKSKNQICKIKLGAKMQANISSSYQSLKNVTDKGNKNLIFAHHTCSAILRDFFKSCNEFALNNPLDYKSAQ